MQYVKTIIRDNREIVATLIPLDKVPMWSGDNPKPTIYLATDDVSIGWSRDGDTFTPSPPPAMEQLQKQYTDAVQRRLDTFAQTRGYDGILSACTYVTSAVEHFRAEAEYCVIARDNTWAKCYLILADVQSEQREIPAVYELLAELPALVWPC